MRVSCWAYMYEQFCLGALRFHPVCFVCNIVFKEYMSDSFTNNNYVGNTKVSVSIKKLMPTNAH